MNGASRWLDANAVVEKTNTEAAAKMERMTLLRVDGNRNGAAPYSGRRILAVFFAISFLISCKKEPVAAPQPDLAAQKQKDLAALPQAGSVTDLLTAES